ncbi:MAG: hypothetical protein AB7K09_08765 [Planctomycetota bacterium]
MTLLLLFALGTSLALADSAADLVDEYCTSTDRRRQDAIALELQRTSSGATRTALEAGLASDEKRAKVIDLLGRMHCDDSPGLLKSHLDGADSLAAIAALGQSTNPDAAGMLRERWAAAEPGTDAYKALTAALSTAAMNLDDLEAFAALIDDPARGDDARRIMRRYLDLGGIGAGVPSSADAKSAWAELKKGWRTWSKSQRSSGTDLIPRLRGRHVALRLGDNLMGGASLSSGPLPEWNTVDHTLTAIYFLKPDARGDSTGNYLDIIYSHGRYAGGGRCTNDGLKLRIDDKELVTPGKKNNWNTFEMIVTVTDPAKLMRTYVLKLNGKVATDRPWQMEGDLQGLSLNMRGAVLGALYVR